MAGNPFEGIWNFIRGPRDEYENPPPREADVRASRQVDTSANQRYRVEEGRITQERPGRLDTSGATAPREELSDREKAVETQEYMEAVMKGLQEIRNKEQEVLENRYGRGIFSAFRGLNQWLHETDLGRTVKIAGKVVGGLSMAACAGMMVGTPGLAFSPALALMGKKMAISGAIEAFQYFGGMRRERDPQTGNMRTQIGGRERLRRLDMEAGRNMRGNLEVLAQDARDRFDRGEINAEDYRSRVMTIVRGMQDNEEDILRNDREYEDVRKSNQRVRGFISTGATLGIGLMQGIPFGLQDLDKNGVFHEVVDKWGGIRWTEATSMDSLQSLLGNFGKTRELVAGVGEGAFVGSGFPGNIGEYSRLLGGLGVAAAGMAAQTFREFGTFAQGSRARIQELLSENVRIEDGVVGSLVGAPARGVQQYEQPIGPEPAPTRGVQQYEQPIGPEPLPSRQPLGITEGGEGPAPEGGERFTPLTQAEIRNAANSKEIGQLILSRLGAENVPSNLTYRDFSDRFAEMLRNADAPTRDAMRQFVRDAYTTYEPIAKQPRDVKLESLRRILGMRELLPPPPDEPGAAGDTGVAAPEAVEAKMQRALRREDLLVQPNNLRGIVLERIGAGAVGSKNFTSKKFEEALAGWLTAQTEASINQTQKFIDRSRKYISTIEGLPDDDDRKVLQKNLDAARTILDALEQRIQSRVAVAV